MDYLLHAYHTCSDNVEEDCAVQRPRKRARSPTDETTEVTARKAQKVVKNDGRARCKDYDDESQSVIECARSLYRIHIATVYAYPNPAMETKFVHESWQDALEITGHNIKISPSIVKLVRDLWFILYYTDVVKLTRLGSQCRGELKGKTVPHIEAAYGFRTGDTKKVKAKAFNRALVEDLLDDVGYTYKVHIHCSRIYETSDHPF